LITKLKDWYHKFDWTVCDNCGLCGCLERNSDECWKTEQEEAEARRCGGEL